MKRKNIFLVLLILFITSSVMHGQRIFRPMNPSNPTARYGKSPYSGPPFFYFGSTSYNYKIAHSQYNTHLSYVDAAFASWNSAGQVQFSRTTSGLTLTADAQDYSSWGPAWCYPSWNESTDELMPASSSIVLNTNATWSHFEQHLNAIPPVLDVQTMVVHEAGHIHGLAHPLTDSYTHDATAPTMTGGDNEYFDNSLECRSLETDDIYGTQFLQLRFPTVYSNLQTALNKAEEIGIGYVYIMSDYTLPSNITVPSGANLVIKSGTTLNINDYIPFTGGTITVESGATLNPDIRLQTGSTVVGLYPSIASAFSAASSGQWVHIRGTHTFEDHFTIPSGKVLKTESGTQMNFASGKYLYVYGTIYGVSSTYTATSGTWGGIRFNSGSSGSIQYTNINNASYGIYLISSSSSADVQHCSFEQNYIGARINYSDDTQLSNCDFQNNSYGIYVYYADCDIGDNTFSNNYHGIYVYHCSPALNDNEINNNSGTGIYASSYSSPQLHTMCPNGSGKVNNYIHHNGTGVYSSSSATPNLGIYIDRGTAAMGGFNYFLNNSSYDVLNYNSSYTLRAEVNWWEPSPTYSGAVDIDPDAEELGFFCPKPVVAGNPDNPANALLLSAQILEMDSAYTDAIAIYDQLIAQYTDSGVAGAALTGIERCYRKLNDELELVNYLDKLRDTYPKKFIGTLALYFSAGVYARNGDYETALSRLEEAVAIFRSMQNIPEETAWAMFDLGQVCEILEETNTGLDKSVSESSSMAKAYDIYEQILIDYPDSEAAALLKELMEFEGPRPEPQISGVKNIALLPAYPNPFNLSTRIAFQLDETAPVRIVIYDLLGRQVRTLIDSRVNAGAHETQWNGKDEFGRILPSGIYLCQMLAGTKRQTIKILLAK
ncbi:MAG: T9SS type A sorting domain-containing protein [Candidatus Marinimicrobia bacterium]|nr:T9SS type A sorting domain-containing protein [Candidatus Neomarinimicrobiota bacterium]